jgi:Ni,Fe-hydrogenase I large subunit
MTEYEFEIDGQKYFGNPVLEVGRLQKALAESQAREAKLREEVKEFMKMCDWPKDCMAREAQRGYVCALLGYELDDTALKEIIQQAKRETLLEAADNVFLDHGAGLDNYFGIKAQLRRMAGEAE